MTAVLITNLRSRLSLPIIRCLSRSDIVQLRQILFYKAVSPGRTSLRKLINRYGFKTLLTKSAGAFQLTFRKLLFMMLKRNIFQSCKSSYEFALVKHIPSTIVEDLNSSSTISLIKNLRPDIVLVCSCSQILRRELISISPKGCINVHPSLLPKYRGPRPVFWTLLNREEKAGLTFHFMNENIDAGEIIEQFEIPTNGCKKERVLTDRIFEEAGKVVEKVLINVFEGRVTPKPQDLRLASYYSFPTKEERKRFAKEGFC